MTGHDGHRKRLRARFLQSGLDGFLDYEIVELLLTLGTPRKDCKPMAKEAIRKFGGLRGTLDASLDELQSIRGIGPQNVIGMKLFQAVAERYAKENIPPKICLSSPGDVSAYFRTKIGREKKERFFSVMLDTKNHILKTEQVSVGTINATLVQPREVFQPAIVAMANSIIIVHNHPTGDTTPSHEDILLTKQLADTGRILGIPVTDHLIVSGGSYFSFREKGML